MELYRILFYGGLSLAIIFLILTVILFIVFKIPKVFGDLTGFTQKKSIEEIKKSGYEAKSKQEAIKEQTSKITVRDVVGGTSDSLEQTGKHKSEGRYSGKKATAHDEESTEILGYKGMLGADYRTEILGSDDETGADGRTDILADDDITDILADDTTDVLTDEKTSGNDDKTDILKSDAGEEDTAVLEGKEDDDKTDILTDAAATGEDGAFENDERIIGHYSPEETGVLRSVDAYAADTDKGINRITVVYDVAIVHTDESI